MFSYLFYNNNNFIYCFFNKKYENNLYKKKF